MKGQTRSIKAEHADEGLALTLVAQASCPFRWGRDAPTTAAETAALRGVTKAGLSLGFQCLGQLFPLGHVALQFGAMTG